MKRVSVARANAQLRALVAGLYRDVDEHHARVDARDPVAATVTCRDGCPEAPTGCCALLLLVERAEVDFILARNRFQGSEQTCACETCLDSRLCRPLEACPVVSLRPDGSGAWGVAVLGEVRANLVLPLDSQVQPPSDGIASTVPSTPRSVFASERPSTLTGSCCVSAVLGTYPNVRERASSEPTSVVAALSAVDDGSRTYQVNTRAAQDRDAIVGRSKR